jgi:hypothetical protein
LTHSDFVEETETGPVFGLVELEDDVTDLRFELKEELEGTEGQKTIQAVCLGV